MSGKEMDKLFGYSPGVTGRWLKKNGLTPSKEIISKFKGQAHFKKIDPKDPENVFIKKNYLKIPLKRISVLLGRAETFVQHRMKRLGLKVPKHIIEQRKKMGQFKTGSIPHTKGKKQVEYMSKDAIEKTKATRFQKGGIPKNTLSDGVITTRTNHKKNYTRDYIRISKGVWKELQIYNWEKKNGPVPKGFILACKDGNPHNCKPSNWKLMTKAENVIRNSGSVNLLDGFVAEMIAGHNNPEIKKEILKDPGLLEIKRQSIYLKRQIKQAL